MDTPDSINAEWRKFLRQKAEARARELVTIYRLRELADACNRQMTQAELQERDE